MKIKFEERILEKMTFCKISFGKEVRHTDV